MIADPSRRWRVADAGAGGVPAGIGRVTGLTRSGAAGQGAGEPREAVPAATVILVRDGAGGLETLMLRRNTTLAFAGGMWVWPGGQVDPEDRVGTDELMAARRAGVREVAEEAGLVVDPSTLVPYSHWTPPPMAAKRFATWFFVGLAPEGRLTVTIDDGEIKAHRWMGPSEALDRHKRGEIELAPPTWITLANLSLLRDPGAVIEHARRHEPEIYETHIAAVPGGAAALYAGDAGYAEGDASRPGVRHRLTMTTDGWSYERPDGSVLAP
jgi:8-oxo-dGTP pyrophosphatase MutT (NUDIX family)